MKVMIVVLVAIAVAAVLVLFYGAVRPDSSAGEAQGGLDGGFGFLVPRANVEFADVADVSCADQAIQGFDVPAAGCEIPLPDPSQITLCVPALGTVDVVTKGDEYPDQVVKDSALSCDSPDPIPIYDVDTRLMLQCRVLAPCVVLVRPGS